MTNYPVSRMGVVPNTPPEAIPIHGVMENSLQNGRKSMIFPGVFLSFTDINGVSCNPTYNCPLCKAILSECVIEICSFPCFFVVKD